VAAVETQRQSVRAQAKWVHSSARKARLVTDLIRGRSVPEARTILAFSQRAVAKDVEKVLRSAVANAESRPDLHWNGDDLIISIAYVDEGPTLKRFRARARGRASSIRKRMCHITLELEPNPRALVFDKPAAAEAKPRKARAPKSAAVPAAETAVETTAAATVEEPKTTPAPAEEKPKAARRKKKTEESDS
jgi:large subunit ribosomal protein L22